MGRKRKIIIAAEIFPPDIGGPATYASKLASELIKAGYKVRVLAYGEVAQDFSYPVYYVSRKISFFLRQFIYFLKLLSLGWGADLIYAQGPSVGPAAIFLKKMRSRRVVIKFVGDQSWQQLRMKGTRVGFEEFMEGFGVKWWNLKTWWVQKWQQFALRNADQVIVPSEYLKNVLARYLKLNLATISVIRNGVTLRDEPLSLDTTKNILQIARVENWKGIDVSIKALNNLPSMKLLVVGGGSYKNKLESLARELGIENRVDFIASIKHGRLAEVFSNSFCMVLGSEYEGMPHVVLEAWSFGVPVIVSDFPANIELVRDRETGLVFKTGDEYDLAEKIKLLASDQSLYTKVTRRGFEEHKKYDSSKVMEQTIKFLEGQINGG